MAWLSSVFSAISSILGNPFAAAFMVLGISYLLLSSVLNVHSLKKNAGGGDFKPVMTYFSSVFALMFCAPLAVILLEGPTSGITPAAVGLGLGNWKLGLILTAAILPLSFTAFSSERGIPSCTTTTHFPETRCRALGVLSSMRAPTS